MYQVSRLLLKLNAKKFQSNYFSVSISRARLINEAKRAREEMSYDIKALEDSIIAFQNEDEDKARRKVIAFYFDSNQISQPNCLNSNFNLNKRLSYLRSKNVTENI